MTEAVLLVGGRGTRLRPLTCETPKPVLPTAGVPFLHHVLSRLRDAGVDHVVLATCYLPGQLQAHLGDGSALGLRLTFATEVEPLGTGGAIRNATTHLDSLPGAPVAVLNGDVLSGHDLVRQLAEHASSGADVTLHLTEVSDPRSFGAVPTGRDGRVTAFLEKSSDPVTNRVNAGCYVFDRRVLDEIPAGRPVSVERETFPALLARGALVRGFLDPSYWLDVGTPETFVRGSRDLVLGRLASSALPGPVGESLVLPGARVDAGAVLSGGTTVGAGAVVAAGAAVDGSVLFDGAVVEAGCMLRDSVVGRDGSVGERTRLTGVVVGDRARVGAGNELTAGARVWTGATLPDRALRFSSDEPQG